MIAKLKGTIEYFRGNYAVLDVSGVGYKIFASAHTLGKLVGKKEVALFIHTHVREDEISLYGFLSLEELEIFELLISISGVGPKSGLGILTIATPQTIRAAILNEDASILTKVSGIGKKTAERIILELKNKIADMPEGEKEGALSDSDAVEALLSMGYSAYEAREALKNVSRETKKDVGKIVGEALKFLGKK